MRKSNRFLTRLGLLLTIVLLAACVAPVAPSGDTGAAATAEPAAEEATGGDSGEAAGAMRIGLVTDVGRVNDRSFNQSALEGVLQACEQMGMAEGDDCKYIETQDPADYADNIQQFIDGGFTLVVSVGFALGEATIAAAQANPDIMFIGVDQFQGDALPNLTGLMFYED